MSRVIRCLGHRGAASLVLAFACAAHAAAQSPVPADVVRLLATIKKADAAQLSVSEEDGRFMRVLVVSHGIKRALEIGGANGYSAIWIGLGHRETGGHLTTIEFDDGRAKSAADNIRRAGLAD